MYSFMLYVDKKGGNNCFYLKLKHIVFAKRVITMSITFLLQIV